MNLLNICIKHQSVKPPAHVDEPPQAPAEPMLDFNGYRVKNVSIPVSPPPEPPAADCESCPACGTWDHSQYVGKRLCFHRAYYIGKAGNPVPCEIQKRNCPRNKQT